MGAFNIRRERVSANLFWPINLVPPVVTVEEPPAYERDHFGMVPNCFYFMFSFDYHSSPYQKIPLAPFVRSNMRFARTTRTSG